MNFSLKIEPLKSLLAISRYPLTRPIYPWSVYVAGILVLLTGTYSSAQTLHVAKNGNDQNPGTMSEPLRSIQIALNRAIAGDQISIRSGTYQENLRTQSSGTEVAYIRWSIFKKRCCTRSCYRRWAHFSRQRREERRERRHGSRQCGNRSA